MTYKIWRRFYFMPRHITYDGGKPLAVANQSIWPWCFWFIWLLGSIALSVYVGSVFTGEISAYIMAFGFVGVPILAYQIDPSGPMTVVQELDKDRWFTIRPRGLWRLGSRRFELITSLGHSFGWIDPQKGCAYDPKNQLLIETRLSMSEGKKVAIFIELMSLFTGRGSGSSVGIGTYEVTFISSQLNTPVAHLRRSNVLTGTRELKVNDANADIRLLLSLAILNLEYGAS